MSRALLLGVLAVLLTAAPAAAIEPLTLRDGRLTDAQGREVVLRGINVGYKIPPYLPHDGGGVRTSFTAAEARQLRAWGWNTIRLIVNWAGLEPQRGQIDEGYVRRYRDMVRMAGDAGLHVLVDMHQDEFSEAFAGNGFPRWAADSDGIPFGPSIGHPNDYLQPAVGRAFTNLYGNKNGVQDRFIAAWTALATALRDEPAVMGYDLFNEPSCEVGTTVCDVRPPDFAQSTRPAAELLQPLYERLVPALQQADPDTPVFYEDFFTTAWSHVPYGIGVDRPWPFRNTGLSYHVYCPHPIRSDKPCPDHERDAVGNALANARRNRAFPLMTEFGAVDDLRPTRNLTDLADAQGLSWQFWTLKTWDDPYPGFGADSLNPDADGFSLIDKQGRVKEGKLRLIARAYPERIAGRADGWAFDPDTARFRMTWRPSGDGTTVVSLPLGVHYARGYTVRAEGARVVSPPGSPLVELRGTAERATVEIAPGTTAAPAPAPAARRCASRRTVLVTLPRGATRVRATANGLRIPAARAGARRVRVSLAGLPPGTFRVRVSARAGDRPVAVTRVLRTCAARGR